MPKKAPEKAPDEDPLDLPYRLADLPTPQHAAGLAGLLLVIEAMRRLRIEPRPEVNELTADSVTVRLTKGAMKRLYDCFFNAHEVARGEDHKARPNPEFLRALGMPEGWRTLWAETVARVLRSGAPTQFAPYRDRVPGSKKNLNDWSKTWDDLLADRATTLSGSDLPGVEAQTPEKVLTKATARGAFPLLFTPAACRPGEVVAYQLPDNGRKGATDYRLWPTDSFALAVPDVVDLRWFVKDYPDRLAEWDDERRGNGFYPAAAQVVLPEETALDLLAAARVATGRMAEDAGDLVSSIRVMHLAYGKGSMDVRHVADLSPDDSLLEEYIRVRGESKHPMFRALRVRCLLDGADWTAAADGLFVTYPHELFVHQAGESPRGRFFGQDVRAAFQTIAHNARHPLPHPEEPMTDPPAAAPASLPDTIKITLYGLIRNYVDRRVEERTGKTYRADFKNRDADAQSGFRDAREKVCKDAFLAIRGRHDADFVDYFRGTLCSVPQRVGWDDFGPLADALLTRPGDVKTLAMLALSAHSYLYVQDESDGDSPPDIPSTENDDE